MAQQQVFQAYSQNKGTLLPGQSISVNKYNVQVERYLSQGGFAHVYLVRTPTPVYNTTHHVLKRIAVANETMLTEVKKEVDIMRLLKGHRNIVHLIDAAWHKMPNGLYEVFILMEFCPGGGIIDMMNRRLRERLTEAEILQIFVDVCEGLAYMHNMRPALLHRDLKVENILQSSSTSFKLCDFGSATSVAPRPPANTQEIRALEADLNRHTTLQYRAPEMVDPYLRRPVDEKSDVWALGVLLYKLCYYTTPFEEHGPLAILNVQYRIPPYPVYSNQMVTLIGSMLREHGTQRPSVFELLNVVHGLRGTQSLYKYNVPSPQPFSPLGQASFQTQINQQLPPFTSLSQSLVSSQKNAGVQARDKVLEAIAPMRRGRPNTTKDSPPSSRTSSPSKSHQQHKTLQSPAQGEVSLLGNEWLADGFGAEEEKAWRTAILSKGVNEVAAKSKTEDLWGKRADAGQKEKENTGTSVGFGDDFGAKLWHSIDTNARVDLDIASSTKPTIAPRRPSLHRGLSTRSTSTKLTTGPGISKSKDAFDGLGVLSSEDQRQPTLGEARKLRTGLAVVNGYSSNSISSSLAPGPTASRRPSFSSQQSQAQLKPPSLTSQSQSQSPSVSPAPSASSSSWRPQPPISRPNSSPQLDGLPAEARFPSLEELDATYGESPDLGPGGNLARRPAPHAASQPKLKAVEVSNSQSGLPQTLYRLKDSTGPDDSRNGLLRPNAYKQAGYGDGVRSEQVTGIAMRDARVDVKRIPAPSPDPGLQQNPIDRSRPVLTRKHRSSLSIKQTSQYSEPTSPTTPSGSTLFPSQTEMSKAPAQLLSSSSKVSARPEQKDWLTGDDDMLDTQMSSVSLHSGPPPQVKPKPHPSPSKRSSFTQKTSVPLRSQESGVAQREFQRPSSPRRTQRPTTAPSPNKTRATTPGTSAARVFPPLESKPAPPEQKESQERWIPETAVVKQKHDLRQDSSSSTSTNEGPEDVNRYVPLGTVKAKEMKHISRRKGRQSSVHELVDMWEKEPPRPPPEPKGTGVSFKPQTTQPSALPSSSNQVSQLPYPRSTSPQPMVSPMASRINPSPTRISHEVKKHRKQSSTSAPSATLPPTDRSRPQSLFLFPVSKSNSDSFGFPPSGIHSPGLSPPEEPKPRAGVRRTSISDMVQRYEAISGNVSSGVLGSSPVIAPKNAGLKLGASAAAAAAQNDFYSGGYSPVVSLGDGNANPVALSSVTDSAPIDSNTEWKPSNFRKPSPHISSLQKTETAVEDLLSLYSASNGIGRESGSYPVRRTTRSVQETSRSNDTKASSPERPYQGVGKLIDQWQRKTADADSSRPVSRGGRGGLTPRRGGAISGRGT